MCGESSFYCRENKSQLPSKNNLVLKRAVRVKKLCPWTIEGIFVQKKD